MSDQHHGHKKFEVRSGDSAKIVSNTGLAPVVAQHYNSLPDQGREGRKESRIFHMRSFNNWVKSMLIKEFIKRARENPHMSQGAFRVLDIGAGKGGDLMKWQKGDINHLVCADIAETSLQQAKERYMDNRNRAVRLGFDIFEAEFVAADCTRERLADKYSQSDIVFDVVSCQFTFHYCFESLTQARCMIRNISERLRKGGYFIGTTPNAYELVRRLKESDELSFGNDVYTVTFSSKEDFPLFGCKYNFQLEGVVDCPEFLVNFEMFKILAREQDLELVQRWTFEEFFNDFRNQEGASLLQKMNALETYPAHIGGSLAGHEHDYVHAHEIHKATGKQLGTLSKPEWEALTVYVAYAFVKK
ncbi:mRNA cap guanine-N7 methyltransferase-like isoform X1 [Varroa jacobsoni]|uniref:mRNA cap guanine-N(7) methyltransferase n=1 Tax=Varroa destructor TaxID=109461 RepID=A0A7M7J3A9_VARDE|nr:mRNA cap guanine-N7 methyltransferase-like isoform X2 [Varroa destructor]XP_022692920.1 mRNA cap guanine-N7 methyltransferase-like isoform X1 [Varroa jacobsoni]